MEGQRFKTWTDGDTNTVVLGIENLKQDDEGAYKCVINNGGGEVAHEFNIYVTGKIHQGHYLQGHQSFRIYHQFS